VLFRQVLLLEQCYIATTGSKLVTDDYTFINRLLSQVVSPAPRI
jgi:hypothetical protein